MNDLQPDFTKSGGLLPAIAQDVKTGEILMLAYMNEEAWKQTLKTGEAHYYSRSRNCLWHKGGTSGHTQIIHSIRLDCDRDALILQIEQKGGAACHTGHRSCFFHEYNQGRWQECSPIIFDPKEVYK